MTVKIDGVEPNIFPDVEDLDARDAGVTLRCSWTLELKANQPRSLLS